jgi:hypothetical protein
LHTGWNVLLATCMMGLVAGSPGALADGRDEEFGIRTLSTRADMVSGGDVLVQIDVPSNVDPGDVQVDLNGRDVTDAFHAGAIAGSLVGLVEGLALGRNTLAVTSVGRGRAGAPTARLALVNHPITGPIFSGPQQTPFICEPQSFVLPVTGGNLGPALDADCSIATRVDYVYKSTAGTFKPLPNPNIRPADLAQTTTTHGRTVNYVVRVETGTINRAIYQIAMLHDPAIEPPPSLRARPAGWNERLVYSFGGGCRAGYHQGRSTGGAVLAQVGSDLFISRGYAVAASTLNTFVNRCNDVISAETTMMVKEHFIEQLGPVRYTIGTGASGGSMQQHLIAQNYPGLLDGIQPSSSFADTLTFGVPLSDCALLDHAFSTATQQWTFDQKTAVAGWGTWQHCITNRTWNAGYIPNAPPTASAGCDPAIPPALIYDPVTNRGGARCTWHDDMVNVFGRDPRTGFARRSLDNEGVQYGLAAFRTGQIGAEQFVELNERVGGYDVDGNIVAARTVADPKALRIAYQTGRLDSGSGGLGSVPILDFRAYRDDSGNVHDAVRSYITRARLIGANGHAGNQVILTYSPLGTGAGSSAAVTGEALGLMERWLANIANDKSDVGAALKVLRNKPAGLVDACYTIAGEKITDQAICLQLYPLHGNPRLAAGEPLREDVLKCRLKPLDPSEYPQPLTADQVLRLSAIFPQGVCDYSRRGVGQQIIKDTWLSYPLHGDDDEHEDGGEDE